MQTWILNHNFHVSASKLDRRRLGAQIYEGIHVLSSLLGVNDKLVTPKRSVINHPVSKFWKGYELDLLCYIRYHMIEWYKRGYKSEINEKNYLFLYKELSKNDFEHIGSNPKITDNLIKLHKQILINKDQNLYGGQYAL